MRSGAGCEEGIRPDRIRPGSHNRHIGLKEHPAYGNSMGTTNERNGKYTSAALSIGLLAHVDAGKTTLSEGILYHSGRLKRPGRVDHQDTFLDHDPIERERGITIFLKCTEAELNGRPVTLIDTPGHVDFAAEAERAIAAMDYAILIISGPDGIQNHTRTLWTLLKQYGVPVFLFVNKMDRAGADRGAIIKQLQRELDINCIDFTAYDPDLPDPAADEQLREALIYCDDAMFARFEAGGELAAGDIAGLIRDRRVFPCFFGSALKDEGVKVFLDAVAQLLCEPVRPQEFGARVFKIMEDERGVRLTFLKITGGTLHVRDTLTDAAGNAHKVSQIRIYSGAQYRTADTVQAGAICAVTGLAGTRAGDGFGAEKPGDAPVLVPILARTMHLPEDVRPEDFCRKLKPFAEEDPLLALSPDTEKGGIGVRLMGDVQIEILTRRIHDRFGIDVSFGPGSIVYKETIARPVVGIGHYEPLRHYAEVHLLLAPGERGSGLHFRADCAQEMLDPLLQRSILTSLRDRMPPGVLTGCALTDLQITLIGGRFHARHSETADFKEAASRALRHGLMQAESILLEPVTSFVLTVPRAHVGRCMTQLEAGGARFELIDAGADRVQLRGMAPAALLLDYAGRLPGETAGRGELSYAFAGYERCRDAESVVQASGYDPEADTDHPAGSVFCSRGTSGYVDWREVAGRAHVQLKRSAIPGTPEWQKARAGEEAAQHTPPADATRAKYPADGSYADDKERRTPSAFSAEDRELAEIFERTYGRGKDGGAERTRRIQETAVRTPTGLQTGRMSGRRSDTSRADARERYLIVDGYNIIHAWPELICLAEDGLDAPRGVLNRVLSNYQGYIRAHVIVVYDAWKVKGGIERVFREGNIDVVFTKEAETADAYIEKVTHELAGKYDVTVATSDGAEQMIIWGHGAKRLSALELKADIEKANGEIAAFIAQEKPAANRLFDTLGGEDADRMEQIRLGKHPSD